MTQGILEQMCRNEEHDHEHDQRDDQAESQQPPAADRDEEDGRDDRGRGGEDAQQEPSGLEVDEPLEPLVVALVMKNMYIGGLGGVLLLVLLILLLTGKL